MQLSNLSKLAQVTDIDPLDPAYFIANPETGDKYLSQPISVENVEKIVPSLVPFMNEIWGKLVTEFGPLVSSRNESARLPAIVLCNDSDLASLASGLVVDRSEDAATRVRPLNYETAHNTIYMSIEFLNRMMVSNPIELKFAITEEFVHALTSSAKNHKLGFVNHVSENTTVADYAKPGFYMMKKAEEKVEKDEEHIEALENKYDPEGLLLTENLTRLLVVSLYYPKTQIIITWGNMSDDSAVSLKVEELNKHYAAYGGKDEDLFKLYKSHGGKDKDTLNVRIMKALLSGDIGQVDAAILGPVKRNIISKYLSSMFYHPNKSIYPTTLYDRFAKNIKESDLHIMPYDEEYTRMASRSSDVGEA